jgi:hypothetical protein
VKKDPGALTIEIGVDSLGRYWRLVGGNWLGPYVSSETMVSDMFRALREESNAYQKPEAEKADAGGQA